MQDDFDLLIVGGGINGAGIARDAAGRGMSVCLVEKDDLAQATSSASTKLVHGGLRYLEHYEFRLVRESLIERERLLSIWTSSTLLDSVKYFQRMVRKNWLSHFPLTAALAIR